MLSRIKESVRKAAELAFLPSHAWRRQLYVVRTRIDREEVRGVFSSRTQRGLDKLLDISRHQPEVLLATARQLRRVGRLSEALDLADELWENGETNSDLVAFSCARVWYDNGRQRMGDLALEHARVLHPDWLELYVEEARNQRWRGNASAALGAAEHALELDDGEAHVRDWKLFIGEIKFELGQFAEAVELISGSFPLHPSDDQRYRLGLAYDHVGMNDEAQAQFVEIAAPEGVEPELRLAAIHFHRENYAEAVRAFNGVPLSDSGRLLFVRTQLMLGDTQAVTQAIPPGSTNPELAAARALALELQEDWTGAVAAYRELLTALGPTPSRVTLLHRAARAAFLEGDYELSAELESQCLPGDAKRQIVANGLPGGLRSVAELARRALESETPEAALPLLRKLANSASSREHLEIYYRLLGQVQLSLGNATDAADSFFRANPVRLPHAEESLESYEDLILAEVYSEVWETLTLDRDVTLYESFHGASTSCNPLAICLELLRRDPEETKQHVWVLNEGGAVHPQLRDRSNVHFVERDSWGYYVHLATAGTLVNNTTFPPRFIRREGQQYLNTWHGTPWKHLGRDIAADPYGHDNAGRNFLQATINALPNQHTADTLTSTHDISNLLVRAPIVVGSPRIDQSLSPNGERLEDIRQQLGLLEDRTVVFYAPTWRGSLGALELEAAPFVAAIEELAKQDADVILRFHHLLSDAIDPSMLPSNVVIAPDDIDTNELLALTDILVSDYSSVIFDFAPLNRPIIKYVFDLDTYVSERGLYFSVEDVPGEICHTPEELSKTLGAVLSVDVESTDWSTSPTADLWTTEDGNATERVVELLLNGGTDREGGAPFHRPRALVSLSGLRANGVTRSIRNLMASLPRGETAIQIVVPKVALDTPDARAIADELHQYADITLYTGFHTGVRQETIAWRRLDDLRNPIPPVLIRWIASRMQRERRRYFRETTFQSVVDFDGYIAAQAALIGLGFPQNTHRAYVAHSEFLEEMRTRFPKHRQIGSLLKHFTEIASVSEGAMVRNRRELAEEFAVPAERHRVLPNSLDIDGLLKSSKEPLDPTLEQWFQKPGLHVVIAARLSVEKNQSTVIDAISSLRSEGIDINLVLLGDGPRLSKLKAQAAGLGLSDRVLFAGHQTNPYPAILRSDAMLLPSLHEGQGLVLFEAMLLGLPIVASDITGPATVLAGGRHGKLVVPDFEGIKSGLRALYEGEVPPSQLDIREYQSEAIRAFQTLIGENAVRAGSSQVSEQVGQE